MKPDEIKDAIHRAFRDVALGNGIGLWESQAIDDYQSEEVRSKARERDERLDWRRIKKEDIDRGHSCLSFTDDEGMRFLLPPYLIFSFDYDFDHDPVYWLTKSDFDRFSLFTAEQKRAVVMYLEWVESNRAFHHERPQIRRALSEFWERDENSQPIDDGNAEKPPGDERKP